MNRNSFRSLLWIGSSLTLLFAHCTRPEPLTERTSSDSDTIRNVVVIIGDDHATSALGAYGNELIRTPNLDQLAPRGHHLLAAYANSPVCTPSRQRCSRGAIRTPRASRLLRTALSDEQVTIAEHLRQQGYRTGVVGKTHFNSDLPHGFDTLIQRSDYYAFKKRLGARTLP